MVQTYTYQEAFIDSVQYFDNDELAAKVFIDKYALRNDKNELLEHTPTDMHHRIAAEFARIENQKYKNTKIKALTHDEIFKYLDKFKYIIPQGGGMYGIGNRYKLISLSNCFVLDAPLDSYSSILKVDEQLINISKRRGGCGLDISHIRPANVTVKNAARTSTGIIPFVNRYSNSIREVGQSGRRGALLISLDVHHPEVEQFATCKKNLTQVTGANLSIKLSDSFMDAVINNKEYIQQWPIDSSNPIVCRKISAVTVWNTIITNARNFAEPCLLFFDTINRETPADYYDNFKSICVNPCAELPLSSGDACRLLCLNLLSYVNNPFTNKASFDYNKFKEHAQIAQRLMDDFVDLESEKIQQIIDKIKSDPEPKNIKRDELAMWQRIKKSNDEGRRSGTGITALGDALAALGIKYSSTKSIHETEKIYQTLKLGCYRASVDMAKELGAFMDFDYDKEKACPFIQRIKLEDEQLWLDMKKYGRRNISLITTAPTGSVSLLTQTSSGIEPVFMLKYTRRKKGNPGDKDFKSDFIDQNGDHWMEFEVLHPTFKKWSKITGETNPEKSPWHGCCAEEINWLNRVKLQAAAQKHVCHSISSTINLPEDISIEEVKQIYETAYKVGCKGITVYRKNCRTGVLIDKQPNTAKIRPKNLDCDVYHITAKSQPYFVLVGLNNNQPYEVFAGKNGCLPKHISNGKIVHMRKGVYKAILDDKGEELELSPLAAFYDDYEEALTRMTSAALRHGANIQFIVEQLEKTKGDIQSFGKAIARALKKYIPDGTKVNDTCPTCGQPSLIRESGCIICKQCGYSKCN